MSRSSSGSSNTLLRQLLTAQRPGSAGVSNEKSPANSRTGAASTPLSDKDVCLPGLISEPSSQAPTGDSSPTEDSQQWFNSAEVWQSSDLDFDSVILQSGVDLGISNLTMKEITDQVMCSPDVKQELSPPQTYNTEDSQSQSSEDEPKIEAFPQGSSPGNAGATYIVQPSPQTSTTLQTVSSPTSPTYTNYPCAMPNQVSPGFTRPNLQEVSPKDHQSAHTTPVCSSPNTMVRLNTTVQRQQLLFDRNTPVNTFSITESQPSSPHAVLSTPLANSQTQRPESPVRLANVIRPTQHQTRPFAFTSTSRGLSYGTRSPSQPFRLPNHNADDLRLQGLSQQQQQQPRPTHPYQPESNYGSISVSVESGRNLNSHHSSPSHQSPLSTCSSHSTMSSHSPQHHRMSEPTNYVSQPVNRSQPINSDLTDTENRPLQQSERQTVVPTDPDLSYDPSTSTNNKRRQQLTEQLLRDCGLYGPTQLMVQMVQRHKQIDSEMDDFKRQLDLLVQDINRP